MLALRVLQSCLSALVVSFFFRERLHPSRPPVFFLPGICEKKNCGAKDLSGRWQESSRRLNARVPRHHCRRREDSPIHFTQHDQRPSAVSNMIIWEVFGRARVDLFASEDNSHCPIFFTKSTDALVHEWPSLPLFAGTQASQGTTAQAYSNSPPLEKPTVLFQLLKAAPWPIPLRRDLLSQANGTIWHPRPELWVLHVWPLDGSLSSSPSVS